MREQKAFIEKELFGGNVLKKYLRPFDGCYTHDKEPSGIALSYKRPVFPDQLWLRVKKLLSLLASFSDYDTILTREKMHVDVVSSPSALTGDGNI